MGRAERDKGARTEREIAALISDVLGVDCRRKLGQARDAGDDMQVGRYRIEVKRRAAFAVSGHLRQVEAAVGVGEVGCVVLREDGDREPMALMRLRDLLPLIGGELGEERAC